MAVSDETVRARIDPEVKRQATTALSQMGLSISVAIRLFLDNVSRTGQLPFPIETPNATTIKAIEEMRQGRGERFESAAQLFEDLGI